MSVPPRRPGPRRPGWTVVLPLKGGTGAKSRLGASPALAAAIALDCLDAVLGCPDVARVLVVTPDAGTAAEAPAAGATAVPESRPGAGLPAAVEDGLRPPRASAGPVAVLLGDLPALRPDDLSAALGEAAAGAAGARRGRSAAGDGVRPGRRAHRHGAARRSRRRRPCGRRSGRRPRRRTPAPAPGGWTSRCPGCAATSTPAPTSRPRWRSAWARGRRPPSGRAGRRRYPEPRAGDSAPLRRGDPHRFRDRRRRRRLPVRRRGLRRQRPAAPAGRAAPHGEPRPGRPPRRGPVAGHDRALDRADAGERPEPSPAGSQPRS